MRCSVCGEPLDEREEEFAYAVDDPGDELCDGCRSAFQELDLDYDGCGDEEC